MRQSTSTTGCVRWSVGWLVTHSFDDPHVAPYWPTWPCFFNKKVSDELNSYLDREKWEAKAKSLAADGGTDAAVVNPKATGKLNLTENTPP